MRTWICGAITLACLAIGGAASACPVGEGQVRPRPVVQNVSLQASEMLERASRLETVASSHEAQARALEQQADTLSDRARILRNQATFVNVSDRPSILAVADELVVRARNDRMRASEDRVQAAELRREAQTLRQRAIVLVRNGNGNGNGNGWRVRSNTRSPQSTPVPSEGVTL